VQKLNDADENKPHYRSVLHSHSMVPGGFDVMS
jgi:hypothetical protein